MFGKKKEEEWDRGGDYYNSNNFIDPASGQARVTSGFTPKLMEDEHIICVRDGSSANIKSPLDILDDPQMAKMAPKIAIIVICLFIAGFVLSFLFNGPISGISGLLMMLPHILISTLLPIFILIIIIAAIAWGIATINSGKNYYITDKRIMSFGKNYWQQIPLEDVVSTKVSVKNYNTGTLIIIAIIDRDMKEYAKYVIPQVENILIVKNMLDKAIEKCKASEVQDD